MNNPRICVSTERRGSSAGMYPEPDGLLRSIGRNYGSLHLSVSSDIQQEARRRGKSPARCITKDGHCNFQVQNVDRQKRKYFKDIFTSLLELRWRWTLFVFCLAYFGSWTIFAALWYSIIYFHDDINHFGKDDWKPCISNMHSFAAAFLFSVETQHTTGYGFYQVSDDCPPAIILLCIQSIVGVILEGIMVGLVFVKMTRAKKRSATLVFSRNAVICQRDGKLSFMFRVGDLRTKTHLLNTHIRAQVIRRKTTLEGEVIAYHQEELQISASREKRGRLLLFWPTTLVHTIDETSPLYHLHPTDFTAHNRGFEIIVVLEGIVESTGLMVQARTSYLPSEILWGQNFEELACLKSLLTGERVIDFSRFHETYPVPTVTMSPAELDAAVNGKI